MDDYQLLIDLHKTAVRQGPGGDNETRMAIKLAALDKSRPMKIADIGCGTGASTFVLAQELNASITAVDFLPEFLSELQSRALLRGIADRITTLPCSMDSLPFSDDEFDVIWSEGAVYNMGFQKGISYWRRFLKPGGMMIVSEITWLSSERPLDLQTHWETEYPEIGTASSKIAILEQCGYIPEAYFILPKHCWLENYYRPLQSRLTDFLQRHEHSEQAKEIVEAELNEISIYERYSDYYSYGFYVARKTES